MKIVVPKHSGFCPGVRRAEMNLLKARSDRPGADIAVYGHLIHNKAYIRYLAQRGIRTVAEPDEIGRGTLVVIRTHGLDRGIERILKERYEVLDLTCSTVKKLQLTVERFSKEGYFCLITGEKTHPEVRGLVSYAGSRDGTGLACKTAAAGEEAAAGAGAGVEVAAGAEAAAIAEAQAGGEDKGGGHDRGCRAGCGGEGFCVVENREDLDRFLEGFGSVAPPPQGGKGPNHREHGNRYGKYRGVLIVSQTTGRRELFERVVLKVRAAFGNPQSRTGKMDGDERVLGALGDYNHCGIEVYDSICPVRSLKEQEAVRIGADTDVSFVVGDRMSSNATRLYELLKERYENTWFIETLAEIGRLGIDLKRFSKAQVVSSASTPGFIEDEIVNYLESIQ